MLDTHPGLRRRCPIHSDIREHFRRKRRTFSLHMMESWRWLCMRRKDAWAKSQHFALTPRSRAWRLAPHLLYSNPFCIFGKLYLEQAEPKSLRENSDTLQLVRAWQCSKTSDELAESGTNDKDVTPSSVLCGDTSVLQHIPFSSTCSMRKSF